MFKGRRAGTLTAGVTLVVFGVLFLVSRITDNFDFSFIMSLWPVVLIFLGLEVIGAYLFNSDEKIRYDGWAIVLIMVMCGFSFAMAAAEFLVRNCPEIQQNLHIIY